MLGQTDLLSKEASRIQLLDSWGKINRLVPTYSYGLGLALIANAAKHRLLKKMLDFDEFHFKSIEEVNELFTILINSIWCDRSATGGPRVMYAAHGWVDKSMPLKQSYAQVVRKVYQDVVDQFDYGTKNVRAEVNYWVSKQTCGLITDLIPAKYSSCIDPTTLIFASSLYFKGAWNDKFGASQTKSREFYTYDGDSVLVPFLTSKNKKQYLCQAKTFTVLSLPYRQGKDSNFTMLIFLPNARDGLPDLMTDVAKDEHEFLEKYFPKQQVEVEDLAIPKFKVSETDTDPNNDFLQASSCPPYDLTGMVDPPVGRRFNTSINFDRGVIDVNEEGTTFAGAIADLVKQFSLKDKKTTSTAGSSPSTAAAAAAKKLGSTTSATRSLATNNNKINFVADHPFFLFIVETMGMIALPQDHAVVGFMGFVVNPCTHK